MTLHTALSPKAATKDEQVKQEGSSETPPPMTKKEAVESEMLTSFTSQLTSCKLFATEVLPSLKAAFSFKPS